MLRCHSESQSSSCCTPKSTPEEQQQEGCAAAPCRQPGGTEQLCNQNCTKLICLSVKLRRDTVKTQDSDRLVSKSHCVLQLSDEHSRQISGIDNNCDTYKKEILLPAVPFRGHSRSHTSLLTLSQIRHYIKNDLRQWIWGFHLSNEGMGNFSFSCCKKGNLFIDVLFLRRQYVRMANETSLLLWWTSLVTLWIFSPTTSRQTSNNMPCCWSLRLVVLSHVWLWVDQPIRLLRTCEVSVQSGWGFTLYSGNTHWQTHTRSAAHSFRSTVKFLWV